MKKVGKPVFFIVVILIAVLTYLAFFGLSSQYGDVKKVYIKGADQIRWGIDIRGGVDVTFTPSDGIDADDNQMAAATEVIKVRMASQNITDYEVYTDNDNDRIIVRFPWKVDETDFDPEQAIQELGTTAMLTFREGLELDDDGKPTGTTLENVILEGKDVESAEVLVDTQTNQYIVSLKLFESGVDKFAEATRRLQPTRGIISIWMDDILVSAPQVQAVITDGSASISNPAFTAETAKSLADKINSGALPFKLETENFNTISPSMGMNAKNVMVMAGGIAFLLVSLFMILYYRLPGIIAVIALLGQVTGMIISVTGFFPVFPSFTLTLPGIAGIVLGIGMGVDANVITAERVKEELRNGRTVDGAINIGYKMGFSAIFDSNITMVIVAIILMGAFGPPSSFFAKILNLIFAFIAPSTAGSIYSFGYTLLVGVICNFLFGVTASRLMTQSISKFKPFRKAWLYGGKKNEENA